MNAKWSVLSLLVASALTFTMHTANAKSVVSESTAAAEANGAVDQLANGQWICDDTMPPELCCYMPEAG